MQSTSGSRVAVVLVSLVERSNLRGRNVGFLRSVRAETEQTEVEACGPPIRGDAQQVVGAGVDLAATNPVGTLCELLDIALQLLAGLHNDDFGSALSVTC